MQDDPRKLLENNIERYVLEVQAAEPLQCLRDNDLAESVRAEHYQASTRLYSNDSDKLKMVADLIRGSAYYVRQSNLEDVFLKATGRTLNDKQ
jgi:lipooligosaccharide transport system ATP-binding protein